MLFFLLAQLASAEEYIIVWEEKMNFPFHLAGACHSLLLLCYLTEHDCSDTSEKLFLLPGSCYLCVYVLAGQGRKVKRVSFPMLIARDE